MLSKHLKSPDGSVFSGAGVSVHPPGTVLAKMQRNAHFHSFSKIEKALFYNTDRFSNKQENSRINYGKYKNKELQFCWKATLKIQQHHYLAQVASVQFNNSVKLINFKTSSNQL